MKRILLTGDWHCGHRFGLLPPSLSGLYGTSAVRTKGWNFFEEGLRKWKPFDIVMVNGDAVDGPGTRNGGVEALTTNMEEQTDIAIKVGRRIATLNGVEPRFIFTRGTGYHTGEREDWENQVADAFADYDGVTRKRRDYIGDIMNVKVEDLQFNLRHHIGSSGLPHTRGGPIAKEMVWHALNELWDKLPKADIFVRSHVHYFMKVEMIDRMGLTLPALQLYSSFGAKRCTGHVDYGFVVVDVDGVNTTWHKHIARGLLPVHVVDGNRVNVNRRRHRATTEVSPVSDGES